MLKKGGGLMHPYVKLAKDTVENWVKYRKKIQPPTPLPDEFKRRAGCFVTLYKGNSLRGCIGTILPVYDNLAQEIIENAIAACSRDPRFYPVEEWELPAIEYKVDVLSEPVPVKSLEELDPRKYGVIVVSAENPYKKGVLLPDLEGVDTIEEQLAIAMAKAGIHKGEPIDIYKFTVERYGE